MSDDQLTPDERQRLLHIDDNDRTDELVRKLLRIHDTGNATLERVRLALENPEHTAYVRCANAREALASHHDDFGLQAHTPGLASQPEVLANRAAKAKREAT